MDDEDEIRVGLTLRQIALLFLLCAGAGVAGLVGGYALLWWVVVPVSRMLS